MCETRAAEKAEVEEEKRRGAMSRSLRRQRREENRRTKQVISANSMHGKLTMTDRKHTTIALELRHLL